MSCYNSELRKFSLQISKLYLYHEQKSIENYQKKVEKKISNATERKEMLLYKDILDQIKVIMEEVNVLLEEIELIELLKLYNDIIDTLIMGFAMKSKWLMDENVWLETQIKDFQLKLVKLERDWIDLEAERHYKLCFFKMRNIKASWDYVEDIELYEATNAINGIAYEPAEYYSLDLKPFCKIVNEHMLEWRNEVAIYWCKDILAYYTDKEGETSKNVSDLHNYIGKIYKVNEQFREAQYHFEKSLKIQESMKNNENEKGINHTFLGIIFEKQKLYKEAEIYFTKAITSRESIMGRFHPDISDLYCRLGNTYHKMGKWKESVKNYLIALPALENTYEEGDPQILMTFLNLADNYIELNMEDKAQTYLNKFSRLTLQKFSNDVTLPSPLNNMLQKPENNLKLPKASNLLLVYGQVQKCCSRELLLEMAKFFVVFNHSDALALFNEWCELSGLSFDVIKYGQIKITQDTELPVQQSILKRTLSKDSNSSLMSLKLKSIRNFIKNPIESVKKHI